MLHTQEQLHSAASASSHPTLLHVAAHRCRVATNPSPERAPPVCGVCGAQCQHEGSAAAWTWDSPYRVAQGDRVEVPCAGLCNCILRTLSLPLPYLSYCGVPNVKGNKVVYLDYTHHIHPSNYGTLVERQGRRLQGGGPWIDSLWPGWKKMPPISGSR
eukprot:693948-Pelagomonas_calceolata.AAC.1